MSTKAKKSLFKFSFQDNDILLLGRESKGVPSYIHEKIGISLKIPISNKARSLVMMKAHLGNIDDDLQTINDWKEGRDISRRPKVFHYF